MFQKLFQAESPEAGEDGVQARVFLGAVPALMQSLQ